MYVQLYTFNGSGSLTGPTDAGNFIINEWSDHIYSTQPRTPDWLIEEVYQSGALG